MPEITSKDILKYRNELSTGIKNILIDLEWSQVDLAEKYGNHRQNEPYTKARMSQLVNCYRGEEKKAEELLKWLKECQ